MTRQRKQKRRSRRRSRSQHHAIRVEEDRRTTVATVFWMVATAATLVVIVLLVLGGVYAGAREDPATDEMILGGMIVGAITGLLSLTSGWLSHRWRRVPAPPVITYGAMVVALLPILLLVLVIGSRIRQS